MEIDLYTYLKSEFNTLETAKKFMKKWATELSETLPVKGCESISSRSLAAHCSAILEGKHLDDSGTDILTNYLDTKFGSDLFYAAWSSP